MLWSAMYYHTTVEALTVVWVVHCDIEPIFSNKLALILYCINDNVNLSYALT